MFFGVEGKQPGDRKTEMIVKKEELEKVVKYVKYCQYRI